jgi:divalent metal cation (Fe/Co/Zn/Cd) transporter
VQEELRAKAAAIAGVVSVPRLRAHYVGSVLHVQVNLLIAAGSTAAQSHDVEIDVQRALEDDPRVGEAFVHIDTGEGKDGT